MTTKISGILLAALLGGAAFFMAQFTPSFLNAYLIALIFGMVLAPITAPIPYLNPGINWSAAKLLEWSVVLLAFGMDYKAIVDIGFSSFTIIALVLFVILILTYYLSKVMNCPGKTGWLIGFGTAICGSSAIAALAPKIKAKEEDVAISLASVNLYGSVGMLLLPFIFQLFPQAIHEMAFVIGASLHSVGNVAGAGFAMSDEVGQMALVFKMARVALLSPALILMAWLDTRGKGKSKFEWKLPWYLLVFLVISVFVTVYPLPQIALEFTEFVGKIVLTIAMAAIGLKVNFLQLINDGKKGLVFAALIFALQISMLWLLK